MLTKLSLAAGVMMMAAAFAPGGATAAPAMPQTTLVDVAAKSGTLVQQAASRHRHVRRHARQRRHVHRRHLHLRYRTFNRCGATRSRCSASWGWGTRAFHRCVARNGC